MADFVGLQSKKYIKALKFYNYVLIRLYYTQHVSHLKIYLNYNTAVLYIHLNCVKTVCVIIFSKELIAKHLDLLFAVD